MIVLNGLQSSGHPNFNEYWNRYANHYNSLVQKMEQKGIEISELQEVIEAVQDVERLSYWHSLKRSQKSRVSDRYILQETDGLKKVE